MANGDAPGRSASVVPPWSKYPWRDHLLWVLAGGTVLVLAVIVVLIWPITDWIAAHDVGLIAGPKRAAALQVARESVRTQLLTLGAGVFAAGALIFTARNFRLAQRTVQLTQETLKLTEQGQVTDRYTKAIEQLGSDKLDVRIGGIYALERIARDSARDHPTVIEVLAAFVREHSREQWPLPEHDTDPAPQQKTRPDVQAAVTIIFGQGVPYSGDFYRVQLPYANLASAKLRGTYFQEANFDSANLNGADLRGARLSGASLRSTWLYEADLSDANLTGAHISGTNLGNVNLRGAHLAYAHLNSADLRKAELGGADLSNADLTQAQWPEYAALPPGWTWNPVFEGYLMRDHRDPGLQGTDVPAASQD